MRIIRGKYRGRRVEPPKSFKARPTTDMAKEGLFNILENYYGIEGLKALDLFAGSGNVSYEFASRGCSSVLSVEILQRSTDFIREMATKHKISEITVLKANALRYIEKTKQTFDVIFADPPYDLDQLSQIPDLIFKNGLLNPGGLLIVEHGSNTEFGLHPKLTKSKNYSKVHFSFFEQDEMEEKTPNEE